MKTAFQILYISIIPYTDKNVHKFLVNILYAIDIRNKKTYNIFNQIFCRKGNIYNE